jgi:nucleotide-binding universal stress UspA family protein
VELSQTTLVLRHARQYDRCMAARELSITMDDALAASVRRSAERRGLSVSAWLDEASRNALAIEDGLAAVAEWEAENGPLSPEVLAAADAVLDAAGIPRAR